MTSSWQQSAGSSIWKLFALCSLSIRNGKWLCCCPWLCCHFVRVFELKYLSGRSWVRRHCNGRIGRSSFSDFWNYLRRQLFVLDTYHNRHARIMNNTMLFAATVFGVAFPFPALTRKLELVLQHKKLCEMGQIPRFAFISYIGHSFHGSLIAVLLRSIGWLCAEDSCYCTDVKEMFWVSKVNLYNQDMIWPVWKCSGDAWHALPCRLGSLGGF